MPLSSAQVSCIHRPILSDQWCVEYITSVYLFKESLTHGPLNLCVNEKTVRVRLPVLSVLESHCTPPIPIKIILCICVCRTEWLGLSFITLCELHWLPCDVVVWRCELCCLLTIQAVLLCCVVCVTLSAIYKKIFDVDHHAWDNI